MLILSLLLRMSEKLPDSLKFGHPVAVQVICSYFITISTTFSEITNVYYEIQFQWNKNRKMGPQCNKLAYTTTLLKSVLSPSNASSNHENISLHLCENFTKSLTALSLTSCPKSTVLKTRTVRSSVVALPIIS